MTGKLQLPQLWDRAKYISWPASHESPIVRVPRPSGAPETKSIRRRPGECEYDLFLRCEAYRDSRGMEVWGEKRWRQLIEFRKRSVAKHRREPAGPITGVHHVERPGNWADCWVAVW